MNKTDFGFINQGYKFTLIPTIEFSNTKEYFAIEIKIFMWCLFIDSKKHNDGK